MMIQLTWPVIEYNSLPVYPRQGIAVLEGFLLTWDWARTASTWINWEHDLIGIYIGPEQHHPPVLNHQVGVAVGALVNDHGNEVYHIAAITGNERRILRCLASLSGDIVSREP